MVQNCFNKDTAAAVLSQNAWLYPNDPAYMFDGRIYTWSEVDSVTDAIALNMLHKGISVGMHVGFWSMNTIDLVLHMLAAMKIGAVPAVINYSYKAYEVQNVVRSADVEVIYFGESKRGVNFGAILQEICNDVQGLQAIYPMDGKVNRLLKKGVYFWSEDSLNELYECEKNIDADHIAAITFTSGTTKIPKAVQVTFRNLFSDAAMIAERLQMKRTDRMMAPLPIFHSSGMSATIVQPMIRGVLSFIERQFKAEQVMKDIQQYRATILLAIPSMLELMYRHPSFGAYDLSSLRVALTSGSKIASCRLQEVVSAIGIRHFLMAYGQTECSPIVTTTLYNDPLEVAVHKDGITLPLIDVRIWDIERNALQRTGLVGEIQVRGVNVMRGYYNNEEENCLKFTSDGWLKTTDAGYLDDGGYLHFVARMDDMIIWHGENISPSEIEEVIYEYNEKILAVKVVGVPAEIVQEEIAAVIKADIPVDVDDLREYIKTKLATFKTPKYIFQLDEMPMTYTGKCDISKLRCIVAQMARGKGAAD